MNRILKPTPEREQTVNNLVEPLVSSHLEWLGRALLKAVRRLWHYRAISVERALKTRSEIPTGPYLLTRPEQRGDLLIFVPRGLNSRFVDDVTGGYGYSHITIDCGEVNLPTGDPVMIESTVGRRVKVNFLDEYGPRPFVRIPLAKAGVDPDRFCKCVQSKLGQPYDNIEALTWGEVDDPAKQICSNLATVCLPEELRQDIAEKRQLGLLRRGSVSVHSRPSKHELREFISPNGFAEYFGAPRGKDVHGPGQLAEPRVIRSSPLPVLRRHSRGIGLLLTALAALWLWIYYQRRRTFLSNIHPYRRSR